MASPATNTSSRWLEIDTPTQIPRGSIEAPCAQAHETPAAATNAAPVGLIERLPPELRLMIYDLLFERFPTTLSIRSPVPAVPTILQASPFCRRSDLVPHYLRVGRELKIKMHRTMSAAEVATWVTHAICERLRHFKALRLRWKTGLHVRPRVEVVITFRTAERPASIGWVHSLLFQANMRVLEDAVHGLRECTPGTDELALLLRPYGVSWLHAYPMLTAVTE